MKSENYTARKYDVKKILVIDDDQDLQTNFRDIFELEDYHVLEAKNGQEALNLLESLKDDDLPDVILLDYNMPVMNGAEFSAIKKKHPRLSHIPMILMTANGELFRVMNELDACAYLDKPLTVDQLLRVTFNFVHRHNNSRFSFIT